MGQILQKLTITHLVKTAVFWNSNFPCCVHNKPPLVPYPWMHYFHAITCFFHICFNTRYLPYTKLATDRHDIFMQTDSLAWSKTQKGYNVLTVSNVSPYWAQLTTCLQSLKYTALFQGEPLQRAESMWLEFCCWLFSNDLCCTQAVVHESIVNVVACYRTHTEILVLETGYGGWGILCLSWAPQSKY